MEKYFILIIYISYLLLVSIFTFFVYGIDKSKAKKGKTRIKESTLLLLGSIGGAIGSFLGRIIFHHKTDKKYFSISIIFSLLLEIALAIIIIYLYIL